MVATFIAVSENHHALADDGNKDKPDKYLVRKFFNFISHCGEDHTEYGDHKYACKHGSDKVKYPVCA